MLGVLIGALVFPRPAPPPVAVVPLEPTVEAPAPLPSPTPAPTATATATASPTPEPTPTATPTATPTPEPTPPTCDGDQCSIPELIAILRFVGLPEVEVETGGCIGWHESRGVRDAVNVNTTGPAVGSRDLGLWQINDHYHPDILSVDWRDPHANARVAREVWEDWETVRPGEGWTAWATARFCVPPSYHGGG